MKPVSLKHWVLLIFLTIAGFGLWLRYTYPSFAFIDFSVNRQQALQIAEKTLHDLNPAADGYRHAVVFKREVSADRYLQMNLGFDGLLRFIKQNSFNLFIWEVRFFREGEEEEYSFSISSATGEIVAFKHTLPETVPLADIPRDVLRVRAKEFLQQRFHFNFADYELKADLIRALSNRKEYYFSWEKKGVSVPWSKNPDASTAHLATAIQVSGDQVLSFSKNILTVPEDFTRFLQSQEVTGKNLTAVMRLFYYLLFVGAIYYLFSRGNHLAMHCTKRFYFGLAFFALVLMLLNDLNLFQSFLMKYTTTSSLNSYLYRSVIEELVLSLLIAFSMIIPAMAGETLRLESRKNAPEGSFLHYIYSSFLTRPVAELILIGYAVAAIMFGLQAAIFEGGRTFLHVWNEQYWRSQFTTGYLPFLAAFTESFKASVLEEFMYRMFAINLGKKFLKSTTLAVLISSALWGFGHSNYPVFPMWFRGIEMTLIGIFMSVMYLRFGIIPVLIGHFLFDLIWHTTGYVAGHAGNFYFWTSLGVIVLPLAWAVLAFLVNRTPQERPLSWNLNKSQKYNVGILTTYLTANAAKYRTYAPQTLKEEIAAHGWDYAVVDVAVENFLKSLN